jgi:hypothetical protein
MGSPNEKAAFSNVVAVKTRLKEYPFDSAHFDATFTDGTHIQQLLEDEIVFTEYSRFHYLRTHEKGLHKEVVLGKDVDVQEWRSSRYNDLDLFSVELYLISHPSHSTLAISRSTLVSLLETAKVPATFVEVLGDNNGLFSAAQNIDDQDGSPTSLSLQVKIPLGPYINGSFYYRYDLINQSTTAFIFFNERLIKRLECVLEPQKSQPKDPFLILSNLISESCYIIEASRSFLDQEVQLREASTGATLIAAMPRNIAPIEQYPPLFDQLHTTQQQLMYMESAIDFQTRLIQFLKDQHTVLTQLRQQDQVVKFEGKTQIKVHAQKVKTALDFSASQMENMLSQVQTLSLRIRIQLGIVSLSATPSCPSGYLSGPANRKQR